MLGHELPQNEALLDRIKLRDLVSAVRLRKSMVLLTAATCVALAFVYIALREPAYRAKTQLMVFNTKLAPGREDAVFAETQLDPTFLETQIEIMKSDKIGLDVINRIGIATFDGAGKTGIFGWLPQFGGEPTEEAQSASVTARKLKVLKTLQRGLTVERYGLSYIIGLSFTTADPQLAARVTNEFARSYVEDQESGRFEAAQTASAWLRDRMRDLGARTRIISTALPPNDDSNLRKVLVLSAAALLGLLLGTIMAIARSMFDHRLLTPEQLVGATGVECLGTVPWFGAGLGLNKTAAGGIAAVGHGRSASAGGRGRFQNSCRAACRASPSDRSTG